MKVAVITPYYKESLETLRRCHESVLRQAHASTHILVADGCPRPEVSGWDAQHMVLPVSHADVGDTPRALGGLSAMAQGFDAVAFLDADNWYAEDHVQSLVELCRRTGCKVAFSGRQVVLSTGELCPYDDRDLLERRHVDTNCYFTTADAAFLLPIWSSLGPELAPVGDRIVFAAVRTAKLSHAWSGKRTVFYESRWANHFKAMGKEPPPDVHAVDQKAVWARYSHRRMMSRLGFDPVRLLIEEGRARAALNAARGRPGGQGAAIRAGEDPN